MLKKPIAYTDYNGNPQVETHYFNLNKAELAELQVSTAGGLGERINNAIESQDPAVIVSVLKEIILKAYGQKSDDGKRFIKTEEMRNEFSQTEAYSELFGELVQNPDAVSEFVTGIVPPDIAQKINEEKNAN